MKRQAKLIAKLLGKIASCQAVQNARNQQFTMFRSEAAMFESATHHGPCSTVPEAPGFGEDEVHTSVDCFALARQQAICQVVKVALVQMFDPVVRWRGRFACAVALIPNAHLCAPAIAFAPEYSFDTHSCTAITAPAGVDAPL